MKAYSKKEQHKERIKQVRLTMTIARIIDIDTIYAISGKRSYKSPDYFKGKTIEDYITFLQRVADEDFDGSWENMLWEFELINGDDNDSFDVDVELL